MGLTDEIEEDGESFGNISWKGTLGMKTTTIKKTLRVVANMFSLYY
jgi:hypothetical protein